METRNILNCPKNTRIVLFKLPSSSVQWFLLFEIANNLLLSS